MRGREAGQQRTTERGEKTGQGEAERVIVNAVKCRKGHSEAMRLIDLSSHSFTSAQFNSRSFIDMMRPLSLFVTMSVGAEEYSQTKTLHLQNVNISATRTLYIPLHVHALFEVF